MLTTPVAFIIFNRPETTKKVFETIRVASPSKLLVIADGPRLDKTGEAQRCEDARKIIEGVDWDCEILKNYSDTNMGCKKRVSSGLDWVFKNVGEAIILEDDCVPHPTFFRYCEEMLVKYRHDERVMSISGANFQFGRKRTDYSYYFSQYSIIWGWASWRRAWEKYDVNMSLWPEIKAGNWLYDIFPDKGVRKYWIGAFDGVFKCKIDTWDYQFEFACLVNNGLSIIPKINLVSNIGFGADATRTKEICKVSNIPVEKMDFPLNDPPFVIRDKKADNLTERGQYVIHSFIEYAIVKLKDLLIR
ncbi:MAG: glycosyltransferase family 2 protein [bacterium]|nr:glycosyltransferase family 2 protein [bacterium]